MASDLWVDKYRPKSISEYVFVDKNQKAQVKSWIKDGIVPHLLLSGHAGTGKTTLAKVMLNELGIDPGDVMMINASSDTGIDNIRERIVGFASSMPFGDWKIIILDECDYLSPNAQAALRNAMEQFSNTARFILTCNYPQKVIPAIHSRCQSFHITKLDESEFATKVAEILITEGVEFGESDLDTLDSYVKASYPDLRKCINSCQQNIVENKLVPPTNNESSSSDYMISAIDLFKQREYTKARKLICSQIKLDEVDALFKLMYQNLEFWADTQDKEDQAIVIIRDGLVKAGMCADPEINIAATLIELQLIAEG